MTTLEITAEGIFRLVDDADLLVVGIRGVAMVRLDDVLLVARVLFRIIRHCAGLLAG